MILKVKYWNIRLLLPFGVLEILARVDPYTSMNLRVTTEKNYEIKIVWPRKLSSLTKNRTWVQNYGKNITKKNYPRSDTIVGLAEMEGMIH